MDHRFDPDSDVPESSTDAPGAAGDAVTPGGSADPEPSDGPSPPVDPDSDGDSDDLGLRACARDFDDSFGLENERVAAAVIGQPPRLQEKIGGRWVLYEQLGRGGMGTVYAAYDLELDRKVAIKFLRVRWQADVERARAGLMWEGRSMARVEDRTNVVHVYDVRNENGRAYLVMEFIGGKEGPATLRTWQDEASRSVDEILRAYLQAGRGLAAIHRAGLVHRDFKPANVFVTRDDGGSMRCVVGDLGLVFGESSPSARPDGVFDDASSAKGQPYSASRALLGTLPYMAPEQLRQESASPRSDQFSFCVALFEALYGARPFPAAREQPDAQLEAIEAGLRTPRPPAGRRVPTRVERALRRGLSARADDRFSDMQELLAALAPPQRRLWPVPVVFVAAAALLLALTWNREPDPCMARVEAQMRELAEVERMLGERMAAADGEVERALWKALREELGALGEAWHAGHALVCEQTRANPASEGVLERNDHRRACLARQGRMLTYVRGRLGEGHAFAPSLEELNAYIDKLVARRDTDCLDPEVVRLFPRRPEKDRAAMAAIEAVEAQLSEIGFELSRLRLDELVKREKTARAALAAAKEIQVDGEPYAPLVAEVSFRLGDILTYVDEHEEAEDVLARARIDAERSHDDTLAAELWLYRIKYALVDRGALKRAVSWLSAAESALLRIGALAHGEVEGHGAPMPSDSPSLMRAGYLEVRGFLASSREDYEEAEEMHGRALAMYDALVGRTDDPALRAFRASKALKNRANAAFHQRKWERARDDYLQLLELRTELFGAEHPLIVDAWFSLGRAESRLGRRDIALAHFERARALASRLKEDELVAEKLAVLVAIVDENGAAYYAAPERPEAASFVQGARDAAGEILAVHARRRGTPFMEDFARFREYTALASAAEMSYEHAGRAGTAAMEALEQAGRYLTMALGYFDRPDIPVTCRLQGIRHRALYSAGSVACRAGQRERARELFGEALAPAAGCEPDRARALTEEIERYIRDDGLADECLPAAATRMFEERRDIDDGNRTNRTNRESNTPHVPGP